MSKMRVLLIIVLLVAGVGIFLSVGKSNPEDTVRSAIIIAHDRPLDYSLIPLEEAWDRLCVFGPYTTNTAATEVLGFEWEIDRYSRVAYHDSISALVFANQNKIIYYFDVERKLADFYKVFNKCYAKEEAIFIKRNGYYELHSK